MSQSQSADKLKRFSVMLKPATINEIKRLSKEADMPYSTLARHCIHKGLKEAQQLDKLGAAGMIAVSQEQINKFKKMMLVTGDN